MKKGALIFWVAVLVLVVGGVGASFFVKAGPGNLDPLVQCIANNGIKFYGAFWCPHCQRTKAEFGSSAHLLPYVECSTADGQGQTQVCKDKGISTYPTWIRPDGTSLVGEHTVQEWASFSGCTLDGQPIAPTTATSSSSEATKVQ